MRGVESLSAVRVTGSVGVCGALRACKKHVKSYNTAKFDSLKDALLAAPRLRPVIGFHIFGTSLQSFVQSTKSKKTYTTVRFGGGGGTGPGRAALGWAGLGGWAGLAWAVGWADSWVRGSLSGSCG